MDLRFGRELYDKARPDYPEQIFDDLFAIGVSIRAPRCWTLGCGTGKQRVILRVEDAASCASSLVRSCGGCAPQSRTVPRVEVVIPISNRGSRASLVSTGARGDVVALARSGRALRKDGTRSEPGGYSQSSTVVTRFPMDSISSSPRIRNATRR